MTERNNGRDGGGPAQEPDTVAALKHWAAFGAPGPAPTEMYVPPERLLRPEAQIQRPRTIRIGWLFEPEHFERLRMGHEAQEMEDKWNCYFDPDTGLFHAHRSWTDNEIFRMPLEDHGAFASAESFEVEQDPQRYIATDEQEIKQSLGMLLTYVMQAAPVVVD